MYIDVRMPGQAQFRWRADETKTRKCRVLGCTRHALTFAMTASLTSILFWCFTGSLLEGYCAVAVETSTMFQRRGSHTASAARILGWVHFAPRVHGCCEIGHLFQNSQSGVDFCERGIEHALERSAFVFELHLPIRELDAETL